MRVGFAGTPEFAARILAALIAGHYTIPVCLTQPDRPKGRGMRTTASPVKIVAQRHGIPVVQPATLKSGHARGAIVAIPIDVLVVAAYGLLLPDGVLNWPHHGCLNVHASLLPRWRGAAPIERAIEAGDLFTGVTIMQMDAGLDTGPAVMAMRVPIARDETAGSLMRKLADAGALAILESLRSLQDRRALTSAPQPAEGVSYARKIDSSEASVHWTDPATAVERKIRAFDPTPGVYSWLGGERIKLWRGEVIPSANTAAPGRIIAAGAQGMDVVCGEDALRIIELQPPGGRRMSTAAFLSGRKLDADAEFSADAPQSAKR